MKKEKTMRYVNILLILILLNSCSNSKKKLDKEKKETQSTFILGADLSYINELEDCGAKYKNAKGEFDDPFKIFKDYGTNLVRVRIWHNPTWTNYSDYDDVKKTIQRAKKSGMKVLLDFHYSDTWTDPGKQWIPAAWEEHIDNTPVLGKLLYDYTYHTLDSLAKANLLPDMVQVGNEMDAMILQKDVLKWPIDWERNSHLINMGIKAVRDIEKKENKNIDIILHIAKPDNAISWFKDAAANGITDFDWIGLSYYPIWSKYKISNVSEVFKTLINTHKKRLIVVETSYPFTLNNLDEAGNVLDEKCIIEGYPPTEEGQLKFLNDLKEQIKIAGGEGLVYWEPAWVSTSCKTLWSTGSHWDNAILFRANGTPTKGMSFYTQKN